MLSSRHVPFFPRELHILRMLQTVLDTTGAGEPEEEKFSFSFCCSAPPFLPFVTLVYSSRMVKISYSKDEEALLSNKPPASVPLPSISLDSRLFSARSDLFLSVFMMSAVKGFLDRSVILLHNAPSFPQNAGPFYGGNDSPSSIPPSSELTQTTACARHSPPPPLSRIIFVIPSSSLVGPPFPLLKICSQTNFE